MVNNGIVEEIANTPPLREAADLQTKLWLGDGYEAQLEAAEREGDPGALACLHGNRAKVANVGLDVRGAGGYVVVPPSVHPSGHVYTWDLGISWYEDDRQVINCEMNVRPGHNTPLTDFRQPPPVFRRTVTRHPA